MSDLASLTIELVRAFNEARERLVAARLAEGFDMSRMWWREQDSPEPGVFRRATLMHGDVGSDDSIALGSVDAGYEGGWR